MSVQFSEPPPKPGDQAEEFIAALKARPGEWAVYADSAPSSLVTRINQGIAAGFVPAGAFEATARTVETEPQRRFKVWVRYIGSSKGVS